MLKGKKSNRYWTKDRCAAEAKKYETKAAFQEGSKGAHLAAYRNGWLDDIRKHMIEVKKPKGYWTKEKCAKEAKKFSTRSEFQKEAKDAYMAAIRYGWVDAVCKHMKYLQNPRGYWTKEKCAKEAKKYKSRSEFQKKSSNVEAAARRHGWIDEICAHMEKKGSRYERAIYAFEFEDKSVYVGLSYDPESRMTSHLSSKNIVGKKARNTAYLFRVLTDFLPREKAAKKEAYYILDYTRNGWRILNLARAGGLGGDVRKWTKEKCKEEAIKYKTRSEFQKKSSAAYDAAHRKGWLDEVCAHISKPAKKSNGYWTLETCGAEAVKFKSRSKFEKGSNRAYHAALKYGWLDAICAHMTQLRKPKNYWTKERCLAEALKYKRRVDFQKESCSAYHAALKYGWLNEICAFMTPR